MADQRFNVNCGFFDSIDKDRLYSADEMNRPYKRVISNGVFATPRGTPSNDLQVFASGNNMIITVSPGEGLFGDKWFQNPISLPITVPSNTNVVPRVDSVIAQVDKRQTGRLGNIVYRTGTPSTNPVAPTINDTDNVIEYRIANIRVEAGTSIIKQSNITDLRGSNECPWVTSLIQQVDTTELFNQYAIAYQNYYNESTADFSNWSAEMKAEFEQWLENLTEQLSVATNIIILNHDYITSATVSSVPIGIPSFDKTNDILLVFINGVKVTEGVNYVIDANGENIELTTEILAGQIVNFFVMKSVIAADIQTTATMIQQLDAKVSSLEDTTDLVDSVTYVSNGMTDNIDLSDLVKTFLAGGNDNKQLEIYVFGTLGVSNPVISGDTEYWFDFASEGATRRVRLNFGNANQIDIDNTNSADAVGIIGTNIEIYNMDINMRNCTKAQIIEGDLIFHNCKFNMKEIASGSGNIIGVTQGTFYDCEFTVIGETGSAYCVSGDGNVTRLTNCKLIAYNATGASLDSIAVETQGAESDNVLLMTGCSCPVVAKTGYKQDDVVKVQNGFYCLTGNMLGVAADLYDTGEGMTEVGTIIISK